MLLYHPIIRAAVLLIPFLYAESILAQEEPFPDIKYPNPVQMGIAPESQYHRCFESPQASKEANRRLSAISRAWLTEDAVYIITPEERCVFLHLDTEEERNQFIEQFWSAREADPISLDYDFKVEHYQRIVFANEKYGGQIDGWKTDRGRIYVLFGPPDSVNQNTTPVPGNAELGQTTNAQLRPSEAWHYHYIKGLGENVQFDFVYRDSRKDYVLRPEDNDLLARADPNPDSFPVTPEHLQLWIITSRPPTIRFKDLEAILTTQIARDQVKFTQHIQFAAATRATSLVGIQIQIPCEACTRAGQIVPSQAYPLFVRVTGSTGRVVSTSELTAETAVADKSDSTFSLETHLDIPLRPGTYQLAIVAKNPITNEVGVVRTPVDVPAYEALTTKN